MHFTAADTTVEALMLRTYERRSRFFSEDLFYDPAWMIMLRLRASDAPLNDVELGGISGIPALLLRRWLTVLLHHGYIIADGREADVGQRYRLAPAASRKLDQVFRETATD